MAVLIAAAWTFEASAQVTARGRATGTLVRATDGSEETTPPGSVDGSGSSNSDTGVQEAVEGTADDSFDVTAAGSLSSGADGSALDGSARTEGLADDTDSSVRSEGSSSVASIGPVTGVVTGARAETTCFDQASALTDITVVDIAGNTVAVPAEVVTTISEVASEGPTGNENVTVVVNRRETVNDAENLRRFARAESVTIRGSDGSGETETVISSAQAELNNLPAECFGPDCVPDFSGSEKEGEISDDADGSGGASSGDTITYTIEISSQCQEDDVSVVDRIPEGTSYVDGSLTVSDTEDGTGTPVTATVDSCPAEPFPGCEGEDDVDDSRDCLFFSAGAFTAGDTKFARFDVEVNETQGDFVCNVARIEDKPVVSLVSTADDGDSDGDGDGGSGTGVGSGDLLATTGSGGCSIGSNRAGGMGLLPFAALMALLIGRRTLRKRL